MSQSSPLSQACCGGRVVFLIDESESLRECIAGGTKSKAENIATALNSLLNQLAGTASLEVAVAGYRGDGNNGADVGCRWGGPLAGRRFVPTNVLADAPLMVETRVRTVGASQSGLWEEAVPFPIWYVPQLGGSILPLIGYSYCRHLVAVGTTSGTVWTSPPLIVSFLGELVPQQLAIAAERIHGLSFSGKPPLVLHVHLGGPAAGRPVLYASSDSYLPPGAPGDLFRWSSVLPDPMIALLRSMQVPVGAGARGAIYNATLTDLIRMLSIVKICAQQGAFEAARPAVGQGGAQA
jgi:hypothetical protein